MAIRYAVQNGNWNDPATWDGGTSVPGPDDVVVANGYTVTINVSPITVQRLSTIAEGDAPNNGGQFNLGLTNHTINASEVTGLNSSLSNASVTINGDLIGNLHKTGFTYTTNNGLILTVNGNIKALGGVGFSSDRNVTIQVSGDVIGDTIGSSPAILRTNQWSVFQFTIMCSNVRANKGHGIQCTGRYRASLTVLQNIEGSMSGTATAVDFGWEAMDLIVVDVQGNIVGNAGSALNVTSAVSSAVRQTSCQNIIVNSSATAIIQNEGCSHPITCNSIECYGTGSAISGNTFIARISGNLIWSKVTGSSDGVNPIRGGRVKFRNRDTTYTDYAEMDSSWNATGNYVRQYGSALALQGFPDTGDVRQGIQYGPTNEYTGTCAVPNPGTVLIGVPVDDTVGTAAINSAAVANAVWNTDHASYIPFSLPLINFGNALATMINCGILREIANGSTTSVINLDGSVPTGLENSYIVFVSGPLKGQSRKIVSVVSGETSGSVSIEPSLSSAPSSGEIVWILGRRG